MALVDTKRKESLGQSVVDSVTQSLHSSSVFPGQTLRISYREEFYI